MILWRQADPGRELASRFELCWIRGLHSQQRRADWSNARDLDETPTALVGPVPSRQLGVDLFDLCLQLHKFLGLDGKQFSRQGGQALIGFNALEQRNQVRHPFSGGRAELGGMATDGVGQLDRKSTRLN